MQKAGRRVEGALRARRSFMGCCLLTTFRDFHYARGRFPLAKGEVRNEANLAKRSQLAMRCPFSVKHESAAVAAGQGVYVIGKMRDGSSPKGCDAAAMNVGLERG